jgi:hypothetical protein
MSAVIQHSYRSLSLIADLNWDRVYYILTIVAGLGAGAVIGTFLS